MKIIKLESTPSTNTFISLHRADLEPPCMIMALEQTAGRGQRGNSWESEPGKNLTFSIYLTPHDFPARNQFFISEAFALGILDALAAIGVDARVKWPNDIYVADRKLCGILIEHSVMGMNLMHTIAGAGINLNQQRFLSDAPNPVSVWQLKGEETDVEWMAIRVAECVERRLDALFRGADATALHAEYMGSLWRGDGAYYSFRDVVADERFEARIEDVEPLGHLILAGRDGVCRRYAFKEVEFLL